MQAEVLDAGKWLYEFQHFLLEVYFVSFRKENGFEVISGVVNAVDLVTFKIHLLFLSLRRGRGEIPQNKFRLGWIRSEKWAVSF